mgnify:CR=1 FL=1
MSDDSIFREVDEAIRQEQLKKLWDRYGLIVVAGAFAIVAGVGGYKGWNWWQAEQAKEAVQSHAMKLQELSARRMELLGSLEQAKMQETVNEAVSSISASVDDSVPTLDEVENKIEQRKAEAMAKAELHEATPEGAEAELRREIDMAQADEKLSELKAELGL